MCKILIIGCPGAGKSTFARKLQNKTSIPLYHLDQIFWNSDKTTVSKEEFTRRLKEILTTPAWIIDGNYKNSLELRLSSCDIVFFLDYPIKTCIDGIYSRIGKPRPDMPWVETKKTRPNSKPSFTPFSKKTASRFMPSSINVPAAK